MAINYHGKKFYNIGPRYYLALPEIVPAQRKEKPKSNGSFH
jgi:hypothetical protein